MSSIPERNVKKTINDLLDVQARPEAKTNLDSLGEPPNGGLLAWTQVLVAFLLFFNPWGLVNSFGVFQAYYQNVLGHSSSDIAWIGTFQGFLLCFVGILTGPIYDRGYARELVLAGTFLMTFGMMMTSISTQYYQVFLAQGVTVGIGAGCLVITSLSVAAHYFTTKRAIAVGITASGGSLGGVLFPIVFRRLLASVGFGWATRTLGFLVLGTLLVALALLRSTIKPSTETRSLLDLSAFKSTGFILLSASYFFNFLGLYLPFFFISDWAEREIGTSPNNAFYLFSILNVGSIFGRIIPGLVADRIGPINTIIPCSFLVAILGFAWLGITTYGGLVAYSVFYGFFSGACVSLPPTIISKIVPDFGKIGTWMGMCFTFGGFGLLIGNPIAGAIIDSQGVGFVGAQCFSAAAVMLGSVLFLCLRLLKGTEGNGLADKIQR